MFSRIASSFCSWQSPTIPDEQQDAGKSVPHPALKEDAILERIALQSDSLRSHARSDEVWRSDDASKTRIPLKKFDLTTLSEVHQTNVRAFDSWWKNAKKHVPRDNVDGTQVDFLSDSGFGQALAQLMREGSDKKAFLGAVELIRRKLLDPCLPVERRANNETWVHELAAHGVENSKEGGISLKRRFLTLESAGMELTQGEFPRKPSKRSRRIKYPSWDGTTPMYQALARNNEDAVMALFRAQPYYQLEEIAPRKDALRVAIEFGNNALIKNIIEWKHIEINFRRYEDEPCPIHVAIEKFNVEVVGLILSHREFDPKFTYKKSELFDYARDYGNNRIASMVNDFLLRKSTECLVSTPNPSIGHASTSNRSDHASTSASEFAMFMSTPSDSPRNDDAVRDDYFQVSEAQGMSFHTEPTHGITANTATPVGSAAEYAPTEEIHSSRSAESDDEASSGPANMRLPAYARRLMRESNARKWY